MIVPILRKGARPLAALSITAFLALSACEKDADKKPDSKTAKATSGEDDDVSTARAPKDEGIDVPTEEDFEEAVANQITPESDLQKELDQLEKQITE